jgi:hypothetical protein
VGASSVPEASPLLAAAIRPGDDYYVGTRCRIFKEPVHEFDGPIILPTLGIGFLGFVRGCDAVNPSGSGRHFFDHMLQSVPRKGGLASIGLFRSAFRVDAERYFYFGMDCSWVSMIEENRADIVK